MVGRLRLRAGGFLIGCLAFHLFETLLKCSQTIVRFLNELYENVL